MRTLCIIPARGGSKRIPRKNLLPLAGKPLVAHSIEHARRAALVERVVVSTDDRDVAAVAEAWGAQIVWRPEALASDSASSESALIHALAQFESGGETSPDLIVFLQCTSPIRGDDDIDTAIRTLISSNADSLFSACRNDKFIWRRTAAGLEPRNYDYRARPREQDFPEEYRENGSIYVLKPWVLRELGNRLGGRIAVHEMGFWSSFQIDSQDDVDLCEWIMQRKVQAATPPRIDPPINLVVFDFDGVFTDNRVVVSQDGVESVVCSRADSLGVSRLREAGVPMMVMSTEAGAVVAARCRKLGLECRQGLRDKGLALKDVLAERRLDPATVIYVGNDLNDLDCLRLVGHGIAVADAVPAVRAAATIVLEASGGHGAVREVCDIVLRAVQGTGA